MKKNRYLRLIYFLVALLILLAACNPNASSTPNPSSLPSFPTPKVPDVAEVDEAIARWESSGNTNYYLEASEITIDAERKIRAIIIDGEIRAAQVLERNGDTWTDPMPFPMDEAQNYTVDRLLERVRRDMLGQGAAPLNMQVSFNISTGIPELVIAEALPDYTPEGTVKLNRGESYNLITSIKALIEESYTPGKDAAFFYTRSNGPAAWCDSLQIFADASSQYANDCTQKALGLQVPGSLMTELNSLLTRFDRLEEERRDGEQVETLTLVGTGVSPADPQTVAEVWALTDRLYQYLSYPLGAGVTLMYIANNDLMGMDMQRQVIQPARIEIDGVLSGASINSTGTHLALADGKGVRSLNVKTGEFTPLLAPPSESTVYRLGSWSTTDRLLVRKVAADGSIQQGLVSLGSTIFNPLPLPQGLTGYGCDTGAAWSPDGAYLAISGLGYGDPCNSAPGLTIIDVESQTATPTQIVARTIQNDGVGIIAGVSNPVWSPNGEWLAFSMDEDTTQPGVFPSRIYVMHPNGDSLAPVSGNARGTAQNPIWASNGLLYFAVIDASTSENGIYQYDITTGQTTLLIPGEDLSPVSVSPDGRFLVYFRQDTLHIYVFLTAEDMPETVPPWEGAPALVIGWLSPPN